MEVVRRGGKDLKFRIKKAGVMYEYNSLSFIATIYELYTTLVKSYLETNNG